LNARPESENTPGPEEQTLSGVSPHGESESPDYNDPFVEVGSTWAGENGWTIRIEEIVVDRCGTTWVRGQNCPWLELHDLVSFLRKENMRPID
jgi:hypothetical protein